MRLRIKVVFPEPRKPVMMVTGILVVMVVFFLDELCLYDRPEACEMPAERDAPPNG
jgi:hypothetical protein